MTPFSDKKCRKMPKTVKIAQKKDRNCVRFFGVLAFFWVYVRGREGVVRVDV